MSDEVGAIVFTDIVGFTQLTADRGDDVALALLERQEAHVRDVLPGGARVVKELGDGLLLWFDCARESLDTCVELQHRFEEEAEGDLPLWVRMGLHWGRPRRRGDDIIGHDVNLAARVVELAGPGEVLCTAALLAECGTVDHVSFEELGPVFVRGVPDPVPLLRVVAAAMPLPARRDDR